MMLIIVIMIILPGLGVDPHLAHHGRGGGHAGHGGVAQHRGHPDSLGGGSGLVMIIMVMVMVMTILLHPHGPADLETHGGPGHLGGVGPCLHRDVTNLSEARINVT